ncbi:AT-rich interactive domain-containing protein 1 [Lactuca sativa]|uniref:ELM2 domain-containing protein n=1 Tax=Lactuca sativa TaxID=4236 RepID=A0A9R1V0L5_LACSA|nr:AT-rich interactive domain-containing protein 1 [Lactuca sativa]KAJ0197495.1 hypothetical protein LSAT_V11C700344040 [Lactuca sativa]
MDLNLDLERFFIDVNMKDEKKCVGFKDVRGKNCGVGEKYGVVNELCVGITEDNKLIRKRKKESYLTLLDWVKKVAINPCDPAIGSLPERSKWKAYGNEHLWKQVLLAKEAMCLKINDDSNSKQSIWQKKQKMHPDMYEDQTKKLIPRCSQRIIIAKETQKIFLSRNPSPNVLECSGSFDSSSDVDDKDSLWAMNYRKKRIPLGRFFQAEVPQWTGETSGSETRWLGTRVWPLEKTEKRNGLIEMERMGKGRQESCGCQYMGSLECVRFHVSEKRWRVKLELGSAFLKWKFGTMGEEVSVAWSQHEEKKFADIIKSNPESSGRSFWDELSVYFKNKKKSVLVSYYFNVYLLRRRAHQNRSDPSNVDSDDDELEKVGRQVKFSSF